MEYFLLFVININKRAYTSKKEAAKIKSSQLL
nr:MAG TPA: hypothetical protein [Caudoviricetes sp.]